MSCPTKHTFTSEHRCCIGLLVTVNVTLNAMAFVCKGLNAGKVLVFEGFRYQKNKEKSHSIQWRCWRKTCRTPLTTNVFDLNDEAAVINVLTVRIM